MITSPVSRPVGYAVSLLAIMTSLMVVQGASAQALPQEYGGVAQVTSLGKGDKGTPPSPPPLPESGPGTMLTLALVAGAGYWTLRRSMTAKSYVAVQQ